MFENGDVVKSKINDRIEMVVTHVDLINESIGVRYWNEKQTAFERKNIVLENKMPSTESSVSRYTLSEGDDKKIEIRPNNSFLHDNVD